MSVLSELVRKHAQEHFMGRDVIDARWDHGPIERVLPGFRVLTVAPKVSSEPWVYISAGACDVPSPTRMEYCLLAKTSDERHVETLSMVSHMHADPRFGVGEGRILRIGRPWIDGSACDHLLVSLPYPLGPEFEWVKGPGIDVRILWLMPITTSEAEFGKRMGVPALEAALEREAVDVLNAARASVV